MKDGVRSPTPADKSLGARIKRRRRMAGMSQSTLGEKIGVSFRQVQKYENGINRVGVSRLEEIAQALNLPVSHFLSSAADSPPTEFDADAFLALPEAPELASAMLRIHDAAVRRQIVDLAKAVAALCRKSDGDGSDGA